MKTVLGWLNPELAAQLQERIEQRDQVIRQLQVDYAVVKRDNAHLRKQVEEAAKSQFYTEHADDAPVWAEDMAEAWRRFLAGHESGKQLQRLANYHEQQTNRAAVFRLTSTDGSAGYARGWHDCTGYFFKTLSADVRPQQDTDTQAPDDAGALRERLAS